MIKVHLYGMMCCFYDRFLIILSSLTLVGVWSDSFGIYFDKISQSFIEMHLLA